MYRNIFLNDELVADPYDELDSYTMAELQADVLGIEMAQEQASFDDETHGGWVDLPVYLEEDGEVTAFCDKPVAEMQSTISADDAAELLVPEIQKSLARAVTGDDIATVKANVERFDMQYPMLRKPLMARVAAPLRREGKRVARRIPPRHITFPIHMQRGEKAQALAIDLKAYRYFSRDGYVPA